MAIVDFSNAVLDVNPDILGGWTPNDCTYVGLAYSGGLYDSNGNRVGGSTREIILNTPTKVSVLYTGAFSASGTEFYLIYNGINLKPWKVSNISFNNGDGYSFVIDIEVSGNT